ncbi:uncharacterized protein [Mytilus edulis]|uniref:uncharacterized protein n=1 Tax=Mytilus edulis TaxID=6550 RepID=UPI0039EE3669
MDDKNNFSLTFPFQKQRKRMSCNVSNKDRLTMEYDNEVDLDKVSMRQLEVLAMKINVDEKTHQIEKNQILEQSGEKIRLLEDENDFLKIKTEDQADKIKQLDNANTKKDREIQKLKNREDELSGKIVELEAQILQTKETIDEQKLEIERLKCELGRVEKEIKQIRTQKESDEKSVKEQIQNLANKQEKRDAEWQSKIEERDAEMQRRNEKRDAEMENKFELLMEKQTKALLHQMQKSSENNDKTTINNTGNIQINQTKSNGAQHNPHTNRQTYPLNTVCPVFGDEKSQENSSRLRRERGHGPCRRQKTE